MFPSILSNKKRRQDDENDGNNDAHLEQRSSIIKPRTRIRAIRRQDDDTLSSFNSPGSSAWDTAAATATTNSNFDSIGSTMAIDSADFRANGRKALLDNMSIVNTWLRQSLIDHDLSQQYKSLEERVRIANAKDGENYIDRPVSQYVDVVAEYHRQQQFFKNLYGCSVPIDVDDNDDDGGGADIVCFGNDENSQIGYPVRRTAIKKKDDDDDSDGGRVFVVPPHLKEFQHVASIPANASFRFISAGGMHSVALSMDGNPYTWGSSDDFALGRTCKPKDDNDDARQDLQSISSHLKEELVDEEDLGIVKGFRTYPDGLNEDGTIIQAVAGDSHVLFLTLRGNVYQSGSYKDMEMDSFSDPCDRNSTSVKGGNAKPTHVHRIKRPCIGIYTRGSLNAALLDDYTMVTWGFGNKGDLARSANMTTLLRIENGVEVYDLTKPFYTIHYTDDEGKAASRPDLDVIYEKFLNPLPPIWPRDITSKQDVVSVATGAYHLLVTAREPTSMRSRLFSSGLNNYGQLGLGGLEDRHQLTLVNELEAKNITKVAAGAHHSLALDSCGFELYAFGRGDYGQLGMGFLATGASEQLPKLVRFPKKSGSNDSNSPEYDVNHIITKISCGDLHSMALTIDNDLFTWGFGESGATGRETKENTDVYFPTLLSLDPCIQTPRVPYCLPFEMAGGGQHSMVLVKRYHS